MIKELEKMGICPVGNCNYAAGHTGAHSDYGLQKIKTEESTVPHKGIRISELIRSLEEYKKLHGDHLLLHVSYAAGNLDMQHREEIE